MVLGALCKGWRGGLGEVVATSSMVYKYLF
jgi:hypothetical protein